MLRLKLLQAPGTSFSAWRRTAQSAIRFLLPAWCIAPRLSASGSENCQRHRRRKSPSRRHYSPGRRAPRRSRRDEWDLRRSPARPAVPGASEPPVAGEARARSGAPVDRRAPPHGLVFARRHHRGRPFGVPQPALRARHFSGRPRYPPRARRRRAQGCAGKIPCSSDDNSPGQHRRRGPLERKQA